MSRALPLLPLALLLILPVRAGAPKAIRPDGAGDVTKTHVAWKTTKGSPFIPSPLLYGSHHARRLGVLI